MKRTTYGNQDIMLRAHSQKISYRIHLFRNRFPVPVCVRASQFELSDHTYVNFIVLRAHTHYVHTCVRTSRVGRKQASEHVDGCCFSCSLRDIRKYSERTSREVDVPAPL